MLLWAIPFKASASFGARLPHRLGRHGATQHSGKENQEKNSGMTIWVCLKMGYLIGKMMIHTWHTISVLNTTFWIKRWTRWKIDCDTLMFFSHLGFPRFRPNEHEQKTQRPWITAHQLCWISWWKGWWLEMSWICGWPFSTPSRTGQILNAHCMPACTYSKSEFSKRLGRFKAAHVLINPRENGDCSLLQCIATSLPHNDC